MNKANIVLEVPYGKIIIEFEDFSFTYYGFKVQFEYEINTKIFNMFLIFHKMMFFNYGYFMKIDEYKENNKITD